MAYHSTHLKMCYNMTTKEELYTMLEKRDMSIPTAIRVEQGILTVKTEEVPIGFKGIALILSPSFFERETLDFIVQYIFDVMLPEEAIF